MIDISLINPIDQPVGKNRLLQELKASLGCDSLSEFRIVVAYAKSGPLLRLEKIIQERREQGVKFSAIFGIDQQGTSAQALKFALDNFDECYVTQERGITFHPKNFAFYFENLARIYIGSNNLTVGGTETNFESAVRIDVSLPSDSGFLVDFEHGWNELLPENCGATRVLTVELLDELIKKGIVLDEAHMQKRRVIRGKDGSVASTTSTPSIKVLPPSALPKKKVQRGAKTETPEPSEVIESSAALEPYGATGFVLQVKPHHNGEIFLSVTAALQNPAFFKWPFNGLTTPKNPGNPAYPQLDPDPVVNISVFGGQEEPILTLNSYSLNTVYYSSKSEIRVTASPLVGIVPDYSIMIMYESETDGIDYEIVIHTPESGQFDNWLAVCNQQMPGGGQQPRRFGWF